MTSDLAARIARFRADYASHRAAEGRRYTSSQLLALPYLTDGPLARQWAVRARGYDAFSRIVLRRAARELNRPARLVDLGAGNGWLSHRAALAGCEAVALDLRDDEVDGLGAASAYLNASPDEFHRVAASFDALPFGDGYFDVGVFNASLHYALDLGRVLAEAIRIVRPGGRLVILDSPFYRSEAHGRQMVIEKHRGARSQFGELANTLLALPFIEFLTPARLESASSGLGLDWRRHRVRYPLWYETRRPLARLRGRRPPSRFDLWECSVP